MEYVWVTFFLLLLLAANGLNVFGMPGNWLLAAFAAGWVWLKPGAGLGWWSVGILLALAAVAEVAEFLLQMWSAKRYGATGRGNWGGIIGAVLGAILGAPFFFGLGALPGALLGAYAGCLVFELSASRPFAEASRAAKGAFFGKSLGMTLKLATGMAMLTLAARQVWPG
ncbi:MAG: DUF456 family protein [Desulfovibrionaceae bacterium]|jgi:uncharacterized protein YqgC (DUF456 family)